MIKKSSQIIPQLSVVSTVENRKIGYHQVFEAPTGPLTKQPDIGRWISIRGIPEVIPNPFGPLAGLPFDGPYILKFPIGSEYIVLPNKVLNDGVVRMHCCRGAKALTDINGYGVRWTVENSLNEVLASVRYGPNYQFEVSNDGINYESCAINWTPNRNNFFSITMDLDKASWHTYFRNAEGNDMTSKTQSVDHRSLIEVSHMRIINAGCSASYSVEIGIGKADERNQYGITYDKEDQ
jgi:hypothetical protein